MSKLPYERWEFLGYHPNAWALQFVHENTARFNTLTTARQVGKTVSARIEIDLGMTEDLDEWGRPPVVGVIAPTYEKAELSVRGYMDMLTKSFGPDYYASNQNQHRLWLPHSGAELHWLSADDPYSVVGYTFSKVIGDECQAIPDLVWEKLRPTMDVRNARGVFFGTPDITEAQTWFRAMWLRGQDPQEESYASHTITAYDNPWMSLENILDAKATLPEKTFRQLYLGEWLDAEGTVFQHIEDATLPGAKFTYNPERRYVMAVDFAIKDDFNFVIIGDLATHTVVHIDRWSNTDPIATYDRIVKIADQWGRPRVGVDATGLGLPMSYELRERGLLVTPYIFTAANKMQWIGGLAGDIEHRRIMFPDYPVLINELKNYVYVKTPSGRLSASAISGYHDDGVSALVLLHQMFKVGNGAVERKEHNYLESSRAGRGAPVYF